MIAHEREIGIETVLFRDLLYEEEHPEHFLVRRPRSWRAADSAGVARADERAAEITRWFSYPDVLREWQKPFRDRPEQGLTIFFTGLSGAGKSAIARCLAARLMEIGECHVTLLDGDVVRKHLSSELGFSREHRDLNVLRLGYVASLVTQHRAGWRSARRSRPTPPRAPRCAPWSNRTAALSRSTCPRRSRYARRATAKGCMHGRARGAHPGVHRRLCQEQNWTATGGPRAATAARGEPQGWGEQRRKDAKGRNVTGTGDE